MQHAVPRLGGVNAGRGFVVAATQRGFSPAKLVGLALAAVLTVCAASYPAVIYGADSRASVRSWDLDAQYPNESAWEKARHSVEISLGDVARWSNRTIRGPGELADLMDAVALVRGRAGQMARFALLKSSMDARSDKARARYSAATTLEARVDAATSWVDAAVRRLGERRLQAWTAADGRLRAHRWRIATIFGNVTTSSRLARSQ
jgi:oligoendopeptidase F